MKKILFLISVISLTFTSCMKGDDTYEKLQPVLPGLNIYASALNQNIISMQQADAGLRLAMLLAEADGEEDFTKVEFNKQNVKNTLFGLDTKVVKVSDNSYKITYTQGIQTPSGYFFKGSLVVNTNGAAQLSQTTPENRWVIIPDQFAIQIMNNSGTASLNVKGGTATLCNNGSGGYTVAVTGSVVNMDEYDINSNWSGSFTLVPPDQSLTYSLCKGKEFKATGNASGKSFYSFDGKSPVEMLYVIENGTYRGSTQNFDGVERSSLTGFMDYDKTLYPSPDVKIVWSALDNQLHQSITYNGVTVEL
ncbi:MAG: hypothetical protein RR199_03735 [Alistipes sp.]